MIEIKCIKCGTIRVANKKSNVGKGKFCSTKCAYASRRVTLIEIKCIRCGNIRTKPKNGVCIKNGKFCSTKCAYAHHTKPIATRFWGHVNKGDGCWTWCGGQRSGYGQFTVTRSQGVRAHRMSWQLTNGLIPKGLFVCHRCDNPLCVRPDHLFLGTPSDNTQDMISKSRNRRKLSNVDIAVIYQEAKMTPRRDLASKFNVSLATINRTINKHEVVNHE